MDLKKKRRIGESIIQGFLFLAAALSILVTIGIVYELGTEAMLFFTRKQWENTNKVITQSLEPGFTEFIVSESGATINEGDLVRLRSEEMLVVNVQDERLKVVRGAEDTEPVFHNEGTTLEKATQVTFLEFFGKTEWNPQIGKFGIWALVNATLMTSLIAITVALPVGLSVAIYLSEYASHRFRSILKPILEVLAGIPTVVYGYFALTFMTPLLRYIFGVDVVEIYNTASAGIVIGILIIPLVSSMSEDALSAVPNGLREASYGLGATKLETSLRVVVPSAISGIAAAFIVAISRAIGETMIVAIASGAGPNFTFNPFKAAETMTGHIVRISGGDLSYNSLDYNSIFAIGLLLFFMTLILNIFSHWIVKRFRKVY
ncbi:MAG: phosphate ABC transporter permease subunit PstC [Brevefilum sp.]|nr:phosphate ABC transporter permease subunit PstC [Brevefilum sp.]MDT8381710.1 phosphate ABC transporter permease subunit PstC [Brevefilum sp.]MDW7754115.1 phosphate ABC transporter permease subunit PstC [Brevefilum sp.]